MGTLSCFDLDFTSAQGCFPPSLPQHVGAGAKAKVAGEASDAIGGSSCCEGIHQRTAGPSFRIEMPWLGDCGRTHLTNFAMENGTYEACSKGHCLI